MRRRRRAEEDSRLSLAYNESVRAITQQQGALEGLHTRAGIVLSAAAITSGLFGSQVLRDGNLTCLNWAALAAFVVAAGGALFVLWPREGWRFSNTVSGLLGTWVDKEDAHVDAMRREVAEFNQNAWSDNQKTMGKMYLAFQVASAALGVEVVLWLIDLGTR